MIPQRNSEQLSKQASFLIMRCYENCNATNCYGYTPQKNLSPDYIRAKKEALKICKKYKDQELHNYIKIQL